MKIRNILFLAVLSVSVLSCTLTRRMERRGTAAALSLMQKRKLAPADSLSENGRHPGEGWVRRPNGDSLYWAGTLVDKDGERRMLIRLDEVRVVGRSKVVVERMGLVTLDFRITVPEQLQGNSLGIVVTPRLHDGDSIVKLERLVVRGGLYGRLQERDLWQFGRYRERMTTLMRNAGDSLRESVLDRAYRRIVRFPRTSGARLDSVVKERERIDYYYTQQVATKGEGKTLRITLHGQVEGLDGSSYLLPVSDTLQYNISSMLSFIDRTPRYVTRVIEKYAVVKARNYLCFRLGDACIIDTLGDNGEQLAHIETLMERLISQAEFYVDSIILSASASPEGRMQTNERLARERAFALKKYLTERFGKETDTLITVRWIAEDWPELSARIRTDRKITNRDAILKLIAAERNPDRREQTIRQRFPKDYAYIKSAIYPQLRAVNFKYALRRKGMIKDTIHTTEPDTLYAEGIRLLEQRHYAEAVRILGPYEDINSAIAMLSAGSGKKAYDILSQIKRSDTTEYLAAIACARLGRIEEGRKHYEEACRMNENLKYRGDLDPEIGNLLKVKKE